MALNIKKKPIKIGKIKRSIPKDVDNTFHDFADKLKNTNFNLDIFYKNIKNVKLINGTKKEMSNLDNVAEYNIFSNAIRYIREYFKIGIMHELFHLASTIHGNNRLFSGFLQMDKRNKRFIGLGLNEGYTAILDDRYFADYDSRKIEVIGKSYLVTKYFVSMVEEAVGHENMEEWYSTCDLESLTKTLATATDYESTKKFYECLDKICLLLESKKFRRKNVRIIMESYEYASVYIARLYLDVLEHAYLDGEICNDDYEDFLLNFKEQLRRPFVIGKIFKTYSEVITNEDFDVLVKEAKTKCLKKYT